MKETVQVSVILITYNPKEAALRSTLDSIVCQEGVDWEVVIADDGSQQKDFSWLPEYFSTHQVQRYQLIENPENMGTVRNYLSGLNAASGEYIFGISPGDMIYDNLVLRDFYQFAKQRDIRFCFGNAVYYSVNNGNIHYQEECIAPKRPDIYAASKWWGKFNFFAYDWICGVSYFRKRDAALLYIEQILDFCKYAEDSPSTAYALAAGEQIWYYDRNIAWYEHGTGISTAGHSKWDEILTQEYKTSFFNLCRLYPEDQLISFSTTIFTEKNLWKLRIKRILRYPLIMAAKFVWRAVFRVDIPHPKKKLLQVSKDDVLRLETFLKGKTA